MPLIPGGSFTFTEDELIDTTDLPLMPDGPQTFVIKASVNRETKAQDGVYTELTFESLDPEYRGRLVYVKLNLDNKNRDTVLYARQTLGRIAKACGFDPVEFGNPANQHDTFELHGIPIKADVITRKSNNPAYPPTNDLRRFRPVDD